MTGCSSVGYLAHLGVGQFHQLWDREDLTADRVARLSPAERDNLEVVAAAKDFAKSLGLAASGSYGQIIERDPNRAVRVIVAAEPDRLEARSWWFPIVGRVSYRGYFDPARAERFADELRRDGYDVYLRPAALYSTLGFFDDPIPTSMLRWKTHQVFDTIVHELVHETIYVANDVAYNEGLATFIAHSATREYFTDEPARMQIIEHEFSDQHRFATLLAALRRDLEELYATEAADWQTRKREIFSRYQEQVYPEQAWQTDRYAGFLSRPLSNAFIIAHETYLAELDCFASELATLGEDLRALIQRHITSPGRDHFPEGNCGESR